MPAAGAATLPDGPLATDPAYDGCLRALLEALISFLPQDAASLEPRLLALMGSAAQGEAVAVRQGDGWLPLSDLDLGLITARPATRTDRDRLQQRLEERLRPLLAELRLRHNPIDLGVVPRFYLARLPVTLEIGELCERPRRLWGDAVLLRGLPRPGAFEALRLWANRLIELRLPAGDVTRDEGERARGDGPPPSGRRAGPWALT
ncbi:MAG: hypothetical protein GF330_08540, partial [Candidatus Eisenbacteria bacterium]|nr:hypothetical protein [Candidatus Eisenbacteria bacterium]